jgi:hypothetical protein
MTESKQPNRSGLPDDWAAVVAQQYEDMARANGLRPSRWKRLILELDAWLGRGVTEMKKPDSQD